MRLGLVSVKTHYTTPVSPNLSYFKSSEVWFRIKWQFLCQFPLPYPHPYHIFDNCLYVWPLVVSIMHWSKASLIKWWPMASLTVWVLSTTSRAQLKCFCILAANVNLSDNDGHRLTEKTTVICALECFLAGVVTAVYHLDFLPKLFDVFVFVKILIIKSKRNDLNWPSLLPNLL